MPMIELWKNAFVTGCLSIIVPVFSLAQCSGSLESITYDTLVIGSGNDSHTFNLAKFDPAMGTLSAVTINSVVSVNYGFTLKNTDSSPINFSIAVGRNDNFQSPVLSAPYNNSIMADIGTFALNPNQTITQAPMTVINRYDNSVSLSDDMLNFVGSGKIGFDYEPQTYTDHSGSSSYNYSASANDTIHFSITYSYCSGIILSEDIIRFSAEKENNAMVKLAWTVDHEKATRMYEIQKSLDGIHFFDAGAVASAADNNQVGDYNYDYPVSPNEHVKLWFRLKMSDPNNITKYSAVKAVDMTGASNAGIYLFPNPSDQFLNIVFNQPQTGKWQVEILASDGIQVQRNYFSNTGMGHIDFKNKLAAGVYFIRAIEQETQKRYVLGFMVR